MAPGPPRRATLFSWLGSATRGIRRRSRSPFSVEKTRISATLLTQVMLQKGIAILAVLCGLAPAAFGLDHELERQLTNQYRDKILALRHSFKSNSQEYDVDGKPVVAGQEGPWTVYGRIAVKKVVLSADKLRFEGKRVLYAWDDREKRLQPSREREDVKITIQLNSPVSSLDQIPALLNLVFAISPEDIV